MVVRNAPPAAQVHADETCCPDGVGDHPGAGIERTRRARTCPFAAETLRAGGLEVRSVNGAVLVWVQCEEESEQGAGRHVRITFFCLAALTKPSRRSASAAQARRPAAVIR